MVAALAAGVLASQAEAPVRFVDFLGFAMRARGLSEGHGRLVDPLYPIGYPALLLVVRGILGDVVLAGKALAVGAGALAAGAAAWMIRPAAGLLLLALPAALTWGSTEGTDMAAAAAGLAALAAAARGRPVLAGALTAAALLTRYTAVAVVPAVLLICPKGRGRLLLALLAGTAPHWAVALATGAPLLPDQSYNLAIASGGRPTGLWSMETLRRWPAGAARALDAALGDGGQRVAVAAGCLGLGVGLLRGDRRAAGLTLYAAAHLALVGAVFANPRLALPATLCLGLGGAWLVPSRLLGLPAIALLAWSLTHRPAPDPHLTRLDAVVSATAHLPGPFLASDPWFHSAHDGWLQQGVPPRAAGPDRQLTPDALVAFARARGFRFIVVDPPRIRRTYPRLEPLLDRLGAAGLTLEAAPGTWRVWRVEGAESAPVSPGPPGRTPP